MHGQNGASDEKGRHDSDQNYKTTRAVGLETSFRYLEPHSHFLAKTYPFVGAWSIPASSVGARGAERDEFDGAQVGSKLVSEFTNIGVLEETCL